MPLIYEPDLTQIYKQGEGWKVTTLVGHADVNSTPLLVRRWSLQARTRSSPIAHEDNEEMLYVIFGDGEAIIGDQRFELGVESMLWLEQGDMCQLIAGEEGLEVLQGCASLLNIPI